MICDLLCCIKKEAACSLLTLVERLSTARVPLDKLTVTSIFYKELFYEFYLNLTKQFITSQQTKQS